MSGNADRGTVLIVGAGPSGMTAAIECARLGLPVRIVDKSDHMARWSQALVVQARTLEQMQRYGIADELIRRGRKMTGGRLFGDGKEIVHIHLAEKIPSRYSYALFIPQRETEAVLNAHMESLGVHTEREVELLAVEASDDSVRVRLRHSDGREEEVQTAWLLGCDGAHSTVRTQLGVPFEGKTIQMDFLLGDLEVEGEDAPGDEISVHLHEGDLVFMGRLDDRLTRVIVGTHGSLEEIKKRGVTLADLQAGLDRNGVRLRVKGSEWMTPFSVNDRQAKSYRVGRVFLAGDASHIHSPVGGQGMNTGIQDVANLIWKLAAAERGAFPELLNSYQDERAPVGRRLLEFTEKTLQVGTAPQHWVAALRNTLAPLITRLDAVQTRAAGFISETDIQYRESAAVVDGGGDGKLRAGDRLPDFGVSGQEKGVLGGWTEPNHLALCLGASAEEVQALAQAFPELRRVELTADALDQAARELLGSQSKLVLLRPDGYVGYRGPLSPAGPLAGYARAVALDGEKASDKL